MDKKTKILLGAVALGFGAYLLWNKSSKKSFVSRGIKNPDCMTTPEVVQDLLGVCSLVCENRDGDLIYLQRPVPCPL